MPTSREEKLFHQLTLTCQENNLLETISLFSFPDYKEVSDTVDGATKSEKMSFAKQANDVIID